MFTVIRIFVIKIKKMVSLNVGVAKCSSQHFFAFCIHQSKTNDNIDFCGGNFVWWSITRTPFCSRWATSLLWADNTCQLTIWHILWIVWYVTGSWTLRNSKVACGSKCKAWVGMNNFTHSYMVLTLSEFFWDDMIYPVKKV